MQVLHLYNLLGKTHRFGLKIQMKKKYNFQLDFAEKHTHSNKFFSECEEIISRLWWSDTLIGVTSLSFWPSSTFLPSNTMLTSQESGACFCTNSPFPNPFLNLLEGNEEENQTHISTSFIMYYKKKRKREKTLHYHDLTGIQISWGYSGSLFKPRPTNLINWSEGLTLSWPEPL